MNADRRCWCGSLAVEPFADGYGRCAACDTLVSQVEPLQSGAVRDDDADFYGRSYFHEHQQRHGRASIEVRSRSDLAERSAFWLRALLEYRLPPGRVLELGCGHGGFLKLVRDAGFDVLGLDLSPSVLDYARRTFGIDVVRGPLEETDLPAGSFDVVAAFDVLEHVPDPLETVRAAAALLRPGGLLVVQTPRYSGDSHAALRAREDPFLAHLNPGVHVHLLTADGMRALFARAGLPDTHFLPPLFAYDMFAVAGRAPIAAVEPAERVAALERAPSGRVVQALLDARQHVDEYRRAAEERLGVIAGLKAACDERLALIERLQAECDRRGAALDALRAPPPPD
jgi:2-polyprenyl-3-methyl-5-hydroxy-6-metoxy-1,4-benzoquinol methylase